MYQITASDNVEPIELPQASRVFESFLDAAHYGVAVLTHKEVLRIGRADAQVEVLEI